MTKIADYIAPSDRDKGSKFRGRSYHDIEFPIYKWIHEDGKNAVLTGYYNTLTFSDTDGIYLTVPDIDPAHPRNPVVQKLLHAESFGKQVDPAPTVHTAEEYDDAIREIAVAVEKREHLNDLDGIVAAIALKVGVNVDA